MSTSFDATIDALAAVRDDARRRGSRDGYFPALYLGVTRTVARRAAEGRFDDPERMARFVETFAGRYLDAHDAWRAGRPTSRSWQVAFDAVASWRPVVLQHLLLGINAHINLDLGVVAAEVAVTPEDLPVLRGDFDTINDVLASMVDGFEVALGTVSPWLGLLDRVGGRTDQEAVRFSLRVARAQAWKAAERLAGTPAADRAEAVDRLDQSVAALGRRVRSPGALLSTALLVIRLRETDGVAEVVDALDAASRAVADGA